MKQEEREKLRKILKDTLLISDMRVIGAVIVSDEPPPRGIWVKLNGIPCFLGSTPEAAKITVKVGDCWNEGRDGELQAEDIEWFDRRGQLGTQWKQEETSLQEQSRRVRVQYNLEWVESLVSPEFPDPNEYDYYSDTRREIPKTLSEEMEGMPQSIEFVYVDGWSGNWVLDDEIEYFRSVILFRVEEDRYVIQLSKEKRAAECGLRLRKVMELDANKDGTLVELREYNGDERVPSMVIQNDGSGRMVLRHMERAE